MLAESSFIIWFYVPFSTVLKHCHGRTRKKVICAGQGFIVAFFPLKAIYNGLFLRGKVPVAFPSIGRWKPALALCGKEVKLLEGIQIGKTDMTSLFYVTREIGKLMKENNYGRIINIASMYGMVGNMAMDTVAYHTSKGGVINFTRAVAAELAKYNITCNAICPGYFDTELTHETLITDEFTAYMKSTVPLGRYGKEGELNAAAIFLGSEEASYVTGVILPVDGGYTAV